MIEIKQPRLAEPESVQRALDVAGILWPPPSRISLRRWRAYGAGKEEWLILPSLRKAWWLLPIGRCSAQALRRHDIGQRNGAAWKILASLQARGILGVLPLARLHVEDSEHEGTIGAELARIMGKRVEVSVRLGRHRVNRQLVLQALSENGQVDAFVKVAISPASDLALRREQDNLERVASLVRGTVACPKVLHFGSWNGKALLVITPLLAGGEPTDEAVSVPVSQMVDFARTAGTVREPIKQADFLMRLETQIEALPPDMGGAALRRACDFLHDEYGETSLELGWWHGDWVPWNMGWDHHKIQLWDWEHFAEGVPVGWDPLHYLSQRIRHDSGTRTEFEVQWQREAEQLMEQELGLNGRQAFAVMLSYLIEVNTRYVADRSSTSVGFQPRPGWGLPLIMRLMNGSQS
ncbi:MAG: hypothetical protein H0V02_08650 [Nocardioidaceae bacterium]|nr:hypothetical protein [Nocardioidaceae bacterium]